MDEQPSLHEIYRLTKDNNQMLHAMRRNAFLGSVVKFIFYILVLVIAPLWVYSTYLQPLLADLQRTMSQVQGTNAKVETQFGSFENFLKQASSVMPSLSQPKQ